MSKSLRIDSPFGGLGCRRPILVTCGSALSQLWRPARRDARRRNVSRSASAVKWLQRWCEERTAAPKPRGGSISPLEEFAAEILDLIAQQPDLTLVETVAELRKRRIKTSRSSLWRFLDRHNITQKKPCKQSNGSEQMWRERA